MELLGHTIRRQIEHDEELLLEENKEEPEEESLPAVKEEYPSPAIEEKNEVAVVDQVQEEKHESFNFNEEDYMFEGESSYFSADQTAISKDYVAPEMKIDKADETIEEADEDEIYEFIEDSKEEQETEDFSSTPVYHDFGADEFLKRFDHKIEEDDKDDIYKDPNTQEDEIYTPSLDNEDKDDELKLFSEDVYTQTHQEESDEEYFDLDFNDSKEEEQPIIREQNQESKPMDFYKSTESYETLAPKYTDEVYKEKLSSLMNYGTSQTQEVSKQKVDVDFAKVNKPKNYDDLQADFAKEGLVVRTHSKMVKESKSTRSYVESNKLNLITSWTTFGFITFLLTLTCLIMNGNSASLNFVFDIKYFLIGIAVLAIVPVIYTVIYFINPYKKKPARYASRIYALFGILLTVQLWLIVYCINLQLGFYSFTQEHYNHLLWIVPLIASIYPIVDAVLHTIYFNSRNFHV